MAFALASRIAEWLLRCRQPASGRILDSVHCENGTYADGFSALTFYLLGWQEAAQGALEVSLRRGLDSEFDSLAHALLLRLLPGQPWPQLRERPLYDGNQLVSKNWALFRALSRELYGGVGRFDALESQLPSGLFPDSPLGQATPTCYHAKICVVLALHRFLLGSEKYGAAFRAGLEALLALVSPSGYLVPYGRSRNTLFAYASSYLALRLGACLFQDGRFSWGAARVLERMSRFQAPDGHIPACLNANEWMRQDWDVYINNPDYNAFAAACLLMAVRLAPEVPPEVSPSTGLSSLGPLLVSRGRDHYFGCSLQGESAPYGSPFFCDMRYAGMSPLIYEGDGQTTIFHDDYCWDGRDQTRRCLLDPRLSRWIPYVERSAGRFWVQTYDRVTVESQPDGLTIRGSGVLAASTPRPGWRRFLENRLLARPALQTVSRRLSQVLLVQLQVNFSAGTIRLEATSEGESCEIHRARVEEQLCPG